MDPKSAARQFLVSTTATTPLSDITDDTNSSYDDGPAENGCTREFPTTENRLYVINRAGTGEASYLLLTEDGVTILSYRVHTERWRPTEGVMNFEVVVLGKFIYVIGGFHKGRAVCLSRVMRYDACEGEWTTCKNMLQPRSRFGACVVDGKIFVCGGERTDGKVTGSCETYDPETDTWTKCGMLVAPRCSSACVSYGGEILCAGGYQGGIAHNNLWVYEHHQWQEMDEYYPHRLPYNLHKCAIAAVDNTFYFIGGVSCKQPKQRPTNNSKNRDSNSNDKSNSPDKEISLTKFHTERRVFSYTTHISAREKTHGGPQPDLISPWNLKLPPMIHARHSAGAVVIGHKIHVVGGTSIETGHAVKVSEHFNLIKGHWEEDFTLRKCDMSNVSCVLLEVPKIPLTERKNTYRLRWVMW